MQYRPFGKLGFEVSALGFGAMRLPTKGNGGEVDAPLAIEMIRHAIDHGVSYVDTAWPYHGGQSERVVGEALRNGYRERVKLATKLPSWEIKSPDDCDRILETQLARLQTGRVDLYLLHCVNRAFWANLQGAGVLDWAERAKADGRIGEVGFSFHDDFDFFREVVDAYDWPMCQIQYNLVGESVQAGTQGLKYAAERGLAVVIMEPLFGGALAVPPEPIRAAWEAAGRRPADGALQWLWDKPEVACVLSGMSTMDQVHQNVAAATRSGVGSLTGEDHALVARVQGLYRRFSPVPCTKCGYCMPCPHGVDIPRNLELYSNGAVFGGNALTLCRNLYRQLPAGTQAAACQACRACEDKCPQSIEVSALMPRVAAELDHPTPQAANRARD
ncbi:MAG TPA: aldo/keto reductase [Phycisphaerae bacterium]|nr:aldo/keto reductase [Phycisphaerae bacterium]